ncbi:Uncharacterised protein [Shigella sonnei]|nr:Uncharacterised protein [Shigella sonnei]
MINLGDAIDKLIDIINRAFTAFAQFTAWRNALTSSSI